MNWTYAMLLAASLTWGGGIGLFAWFMLRIIFRPQSESAQFWEHDEQRRIRLRAGSRIYRWFEPLCLELLACRWLHRTGNLPSVANSLSRCGAALPWTAEEYLATYFVQICALMSLGLAMFSPLLGFSAASMLILPLGLVTWFRVPRALAKSAATRMRKFKQRLPFAIDLMALMMEAGGDFRHCLTTVVRENAEHPVGQEFGILARAHSAGQPLRACLDQMQARLRDEDVNEIVFSIKNAEELGVPLSKTFLTLAEQMRIKRSQQAEKLIGQRKTMMAFPSLIIMVACLLIAVAPFVLDVFHS